jgi:hypothetical protein
VSGGAAPSLEELLESRSRRPRSLVLALVIGVSVGMVVLALARVFPPHAYGLASDFRVLYGAAKAMAAGQDPYAPHVLLRFLQLADPYSYQQPALNYFAYLPVTAVALEPLTLLPFWVAFVVLTALGAGAAGVVTVFLLRDLGWSHDRLTAAVALVSWVSFQGFLYGQVDALLLAALGGAMLLAWHNRPLAAGLVLGFLWVKPDLLWPAPIFLALALWPDRRRVLWFASGFAAISLVALLTSPGRLTSWGHALVRFSAGIGTTQPDLSGLPSLQQAAPSAWGLSGHLLTPGTLAVLSLALVGMAIFGAWLVTSTAWAGVTEVGRVSWAVSVPVGIWLAATPYAHSNDDLLLLPLLVLILGRDVRRLHGAGLWLAVAVVLLLLLAWPVGAVPWPVALGVFGILAVVLWRLREDARLTGFGAGLAVLAVAYLPVLDPIHLLSVSLTPVAALAVVVEGCRTCWMEVGGAGTGPAYASPPTPAPIPG